MPVYIKVREEECTGCGVCVEMCPATPAVFKMDDITAVAVHPEACEECMLCIDNCPTDAIVMQSSGGTFLDIGDL